MYLAEMFSDTPEEFKSEEEDNTQLRGLKDMRKTRLTLSQLNKIRVMNDMRRYEKEKKMDQIKAQYAAPAPEPEL